MHVLGDGPQPVGAVVDRVHRGHVGEEGLRRADVRGRLLAADVLLAGLERHPEGRVAVAVSGEADDAAGQPALEGVGRREEGRVRAAVAERHAEALAVAERDVRAPRARGLEDREGEQVRGDGEERARGVRAVRERGVVHDLAVGRGVLHEHADRVGVGLEGERVDGLDRDPERAGAGLDDRNRLRVAARVDGERAAGGPVGSREERHRLGGGGRLVEQARARDGQARQV